MFHILRVAGFQTENEKTRLGQLGLVGKEEKWSVLGPWQVPAGS